MSVRRATVAWLFFSPSGRAGRKTFILGWLFWMMLNSYVVAKLAIHHDDEGALPAWSAAFLAVFALSVLSAVMMTIKRLHDIGLPGLVAVLMFVPAVSLILLFVLCVWPPQPGANGHGVCSDWPRQQ